MTSRRESDRDLGARRVSIVRYRTHGWTAGTGMVCFVATGRPHVGTSEHRRVGILPRLGRRRPERRGRRAQIAANGAPSLGSESRPPPKQPRAARSAAKPTRYIVFRECCVQIGSKSRTGLPGTSNVHLMRMVPPVTGTAACNARETRVGVLTDVRPAPGEANVPGMDSPARTGRQPRRQSM